jgi:hypothetical protein
VRIITQGQKRRIVYSFKEEIAPGVFEFYLSPVAETTNGRRPMGRYDSQQELEMEVNRRDCQLVWLTS